MSRPHRRRKKAVLVFGESEYDTKAIAAFISALIDDDSIAIEPQRRPPVLVRDATPSTLPGRLHQIAALIRAARVDTDVVGVIAHQDCDAVEPAHEDLAGRIERAFRDVGVEVAAATPAWEMETWLMQWPEAFAEFRPAWRSVDSYIGRNVGMIPNAKEDLTRSLRPNNRGSIRDYRESDAPHLAAIVRDRRLVRAPRATSNSFVAFTTRVDHLATQSASAPGDP